MSSDLLFVGIDLGTEKGVAATTSTVGAKGASLVRNDVSNESTPTLVSFTATRCLVGDSARDQLRSNSTNTIRDIPRLMGRTADDFSSLHGSVPPFTVTSTSRGDAAPCGVQVAYRGEDIVVEPEAAAGMLLAQMMTFVKKANPTPATRITIAVPAFYTDVHIASVWDSIALAGLDASKVVVVDSLTAAASAYGAKHNSSLPSTVAGADNRTVAIVDIGAAITSVGVFHFTSAGPRVVFKRSTPTFGAGVLDHAIFGLVARDANAKHGVELTPTSRAGSRALAEAAKAKKVLSTVARARVELESVLCPDGVDRDIRVEVTAASVLEACSEAKAGLQAVLESAAKATSDAGLTLGSVELIGGGTRVPWVKEVIAEVLCDNLCYTLDSASAVAVGATVLASVPEEEEEEEEKETTAEEAATETETTEEKAATEATTEATTEGDAAADKAVTDEEADTSSAAAGAGAGAAPDADATETSSDEPSKRYTLESPFLPPSDSGLRLGSDALDAALAFRDRVSAQEALISAESSAMNALESFIFSTRAAVSGSHGDKFDADRTKADLDAAEEFMWDAGDIQGAPERVALFNTKREELEASIRGHSGGYYEAVEAEKKAVEAALEASAKAADAAAAEEGEQDHDTRKLKKADRMRLVVKNQQEGNELFKDKNFHHAINRYTKALQHAAKFFDLDEEGEVEVRKVKTSCLLNIAQAAIKLELWNKAMINCQTVLKDHDAENMKALYRYSFAALQAKDYDAADEKLKQAKTLFPDEKSFNKLHTHMAAIRKRQRAQQAKMAAKMFS